MGRISDHDSAKGDLFGELLLSDAARTAPRNLLERGLFPGLMVAFVASSAAAWMSDHYHAPIVLMGLLIGLALNFLSLNPALHPGLDLASRSFLRWGIVFLGFQVTLSQISQLGLVPFAGLFLVMASAGLGGWAGSRLAGQGSAVGILAGGATAICGASAGLAIYGVLGERRLSEARFTLNLVGIALASAIAMSVYPILAKSLNFSDLQAGFLTGAAIHDVAQSIGGGYAFSDAAGNYATIVKLTRVTMLAPLISLLALAIRDREPVPPGRSVVPRLALPWFIGLFLAVIAAQAIVPQLALVKEPSLIVSKVLLLVAVTATAIRTRMELLLNAGWRAMVPVLSATLASFLAALVVAKWLL